MEDISDKTSPSDDGGWKEPQGADLIKLQVDQVFQAVLVDKRRCKDKNESMLYTFDTGDRMVKMFGTAVLDDRLMYVGIGSEVRIIYKGKKSLKDGKTCHDFDIKVREPTKKD